MARSWYAYIGVGDPTLASSYSLAAGVPGCFNGCTICAIYSPAGGTTPTGPLSPNMRRYIAAALITCLSQPQDSGRFKLYVYVKYT